MSTVERNLAPLQAVGPQAATPIRRPAEPVLREVPGCRLCRALAHRLRPQSAATPVWAVGSVTVDDLTRFTSGG